jgi:hypothetical protein
VVIHPLTTGRDNRRVAGRRLVGTPNGAVVWTGSRFVAVGEAGVSLHSPDGATWFQAP